MKHPKKIRSNSGIFLPVISGILTGTAYIVPFLSFLCFFSFIPLLYRILYNKMTCSFTPVFFFSFSYFIISDIWLMNIGFDVTENIFIASAVSLFILFMMSFVISVFCSLPFIIYKNIRKNTVFNIALCGLLYIFGEWLSGSFYPFAFPWNRICNIPANIIPFIQTASIFGGLFISFLILIINGFLAAAIHQLIQIKIKQFSLYFLCAASVFILNISYGLIYICNETEYQEKYTAVIVQGNYFKEEKWETSPEEIAEKYLSLAKSKADCNTDIVIFPETAIKSNFFADPELLKPFTEFCRKNDAVIITGTKQNDRELNYNVCVCINSEGIQPDIYRKRFLVPFGEYSPVGDIKFISSDFSAGDECSLISTDIGKIGCVICFESVFPRSTAECVKNGAQVLTVLTNDSWLGKSVPLYQHHTHSVIRAVENRRFVLTSANTGISSVITPTGRIISQSGINCEDVTSAEFSMISKKSIYTQTGDTIILIPCIIILYGSAKIIIDPTGKYFFVA
ncbi:MAG: apolipoprotein N-acyltransferase [Porcipelethomonas sp.]